MDKKEEMPPSLLKGLSFVTTAYNMRVRKDIIDNMKDDLKKFILSEIEEIRQQLINEIREQVQNEIREQVQNEIRERKNNESCDCEYIQIEK